MVKEGNGVTWRVKERKEEKGVRRNEKEVKGGERRGNE
jgi:hypothetical protein